MYKCPLAIAILAIGLLCSCDADQVQTFKTCEQERLDCHAQQAQDCDKAAEMCIVLAEVACTTAHRPCLSDAGIDPSDLQASLEAQSACYGPLLACMAARKGPQGVDGGSDGGR
jgi:hypothetical protein